MIYIGRVWETNEKIVKKSRQEMIMAQSTAAVMKAAEVAGSGLFPTPCCIQSSGLRLNTTSSDTLPDLSYLGQVSLLCLSVHLVLFCGTYK